LGDLPVGDGAQEKGDERTGKKGSDGKKFLEGTVYYKPGCFGVH